MTLPDQILANAGHLLLELAELRTVMARAAAAGLDRGKHFDC